MPGYRALSAHCQRIDKRQTKYRFDLEADLAWDALDEPGRYFGGRFATSLGIGAAATESAAFQWAMALATCEEFVALETVIVRFTEAERALLGPGRSVVLLVEEEEKHIALFRRWAAHLRAARPDWVAPFERAFAGAARLVGQLDGREKFPDDATYHYVFWLNTLFFEEYTVWLDELLDGEAGLQPAWVAAQRAHRREEEQHLVTDVAHLEALELDEAARDRWSKAFFVRLAESFGGFFGLDAARRFVAEVDPGCAIARPRFAETPFYAELVGGGAFKRTRKAAPYLARLGQAARPRLGALGGWPAPSAAPARYKVSELASAVATAATADDPLVAIVRGAWAEVFGVAPAAIGDDVSFATLGGDSAKAVEIHGRLERALGRTLDHRILVECRTVREFAAFLARPDVAAAAAPVAVADDAVAIIGAVGRFPEARDLDALWSLFARGKSVIAEVPRDRWDADAWYDPDPRAPGKTTCRVGGFLDDVRGFDPEAFGLDERDGRQSDPQQRLFLELAADLLDATGARRRRTGVFVGAGWNDYTARYVLDPSLIGAASALGNLENMVAARVAQTLGLRGPALTVNAACASSLVALHLGCRSLADGECELAIVGGVELNLTVTPYLLFSAAGVLSPSGQCRPFARDASGFVPGEGAVALLLKPLARALADGDEILGVVRGSAMNNDGGALSGMAPSPAGQLDVLRRALAAARLRPRDVGYIEAHGTGTPIGDPVEASALAQLFAVDGVAAGSVRLGSAKGNFGHLFNAAGVLGILKVLLAFRHGALPPSLGAEDPDPRIDFPRTPLRLVAGLEPWPARDGEPRRAGVSAFGVGGTNCHVVLEEPPARRAVEPAARDVELILLSAPSVAELPRVAAAARAAIVAQPDVALGTLAASLDARAARFSARRALPVRSRDEAVAALGSVRDGVVAHRPRVCFVFAGPGSQYPGMGRHLLGEPLFREALVEAGVDPGELEAPEAEMDRIERTQPLVFAFGWALARWLGAHGVVPDAMIGHSAGEYVAACVGGALTVAEGARLVAERGRCMARSAPGGMAAVFAPEARVRPYLGERLGVAALNEPSQVVISGALEELRAAIARLEGDGIAARELRIGCAAHSPLMNDVAAPFTAVLEGVATGALSIPLFSTVTGAAVTSIDRSYWRWHLSAPVRFAEAVRAAAAAGCDAFVEVGAGGSLSHCVRQVLGDGPLVEPLLRRSVAGWEPTMAALGGLFEAGVDVDLARGRARVALPPYPYRKRPLWIDAPDAAPPATPEERDLSAAPSLRDHRVRQRPIAPAALLIDEALAAAPELGGLADVLIGRSLPGDEPRRARVRRRGAEVVLESRVPGGAWEEHLSAHGLAATATATPPLDLPSLRARLGETIAADALYAHLGRSGLTYGPAMRAVTALRRGDGEVLAELTLPDGAGAGHRLHPALVDGAMQAIAGLTLGLAGEEPATFLGFGMREVRIYAPALAGPCVAHVRLAGPLVADAESFRVDVTLADGDGRVLARFVEVALKRFHDPARPRLWAVRWRGEPARERPAPLPKSLLLYGPPSPLSLALRRRLEDAGVHVEATHEPPDPRRGAPAAVLALDADVPSLVALVQALGRAGTQAIDLCLAGRDGTVGGFARALPAEEAGWRCRAIELRDEPTAARLFAEWRAGLDGAGAPVVALAGGERLVPSIDPLAATKPASLRAGGVYLIVGGTGGIGLTLARAFVSRAGARLVLTGRRAAADPALLASLGDAVYVAADVTDGAALRRAIAIAHERFGALHGVVHAAGILDDGLLATRAPERVRAVIAPKVDGGRALLDALADETLDFVALSSSLAALAGGAGQVDYAAANAALDALAQTAPGRVVSIDWGPWRDVGMVAGQADRLAATGLVPMAPDAATRAFFVALGSGERQVIVAAGDPAREAELRARLAPPSAAASIAPSSDALVEAGPVRDFLRRELARALRRSDVDPRASFVSLGVDSLLAVELVRRLERAYGRRLYPTLLFEHKTIEEVAAHVDASALPATGVSADDKDDARSAAPPAWTPDAPLGPNDIEIAVRAAGVNFIDLLAARGLHPTLRGDFVPGHEVAGEVTRVGRAVAEPRVGARVLALVRAGGYGDRVITPAGSAIVLPAALAFDVAAAALIGGLTAISALEHHARLRAGERVLIQAAAGATGSACVQLAVHLGATVFGTASPHKHDTLRRLGVTHAIDYRARDFAAAIRELTGGDGVDVIVDSLSGDAITRGLDILRPGGRFVEIGAAGVIAVPPVDPRRLFAADQSFIACNVARLDRDPPRLRAHLERLVELLAAGVLDPLIHARLPRARAEEAHELLRTRQNVGKVLLIG